VGNLSIEIESLFEAGPLLQDLAGTLLVRPEVWFADNLLQIVKLALLSRCVKGTSALPDFEFSPGQTVQ
jgi:hypothetical protein